MGRTLQALDSGLDERVANAVRSELGARMAGMEGRIVQKILARSGVAEGCSQPSPEPGPEGQTRSQSAQLANRQGLSSRSCDDAAGDRAARADHGRVKVAPKMHVLAAADLPATGTLKHSFLRRFARTEGGPTARGLSQTEEDYVGKMAAPNLMTRLLENVFGICEPDPKVGKEGSKVIHPQSNFHTGMFPTYQMVI